MPAPRTAQERSDEPVRERPGARRSLLDLLIEEAPPPAFDQLVRDVEALGREPAEREWLRTELVKALQVRAALERRRRREAELAALYDTASDLTALRDVELVLQAIVRRARQLLTTDVTYLTLVDTERGDTYMRVTEGSVSSRFQRVRLPLGVGLGGLVAQANSPYTTPRYAVDDRFVHTTEIDTAVAEEGLRAILGVPLRLGGRIIGVLFAADRHERPFTRDEIALLSSLAAHAAIAIENARLFQATEEALSRLAVANKLVEANSLALRQAADAHARLTDLVLRGGTLDELAREVAELLSGSVLVLDPGGRVLAAGGEPADAADRTARDTGQVAQVPVSPDGYAAPVGTPTAETAVSPPAAGPEPTATLPRWTTPVIAGAKRLGALLVTRSNALEQTDVRILERSAQVTGLLLLWRRSLAEAENRTRDELLDDLLAASGRDTPGLLRRAALLGLQLDREYIVGVVDAPQVDRHRLAAASVAVTAELGGFAAEHRAAVVVLLPGAAPEPVGALLADRLRTRLGGSVTIGVAGPASGPTAVAEAHHAAVRCLRVLHALGREGESASMRQLGPYALLLSESGRADLDVFIDSALGRLLDYDRRRGTDLLGTLETYFRCGQHVSRAAEALHVHPNTLYQRLGRIERLLGAGWQEPDTLLQVQLALRLHRLRLSPGPIAG